MVASSANEPSRLGKYILQYRAPIGLTLIAITAFMALWAARVLAVLDPQHQQQCLGAAVLVLELAIEESVGMVGGEKVLELGTDLGHRGNRQVLPDRRGLGGVEHHRLSRCPIGHQSQRTPDDRRHGRVPGQPWRRSCRSLLRLPRD